MERTAKKTRITGETDVSVEIMLDSVKKSEIKSGVAFFDHMLHSMARHGRLYIKLACLGDTEVDDHHSVEDIGISLGMALKEALGGKAGISRFGEATVPMDDALSLVSIDLSGRPFFSYSGPEMKGIVGVYDEELTPEFLRALSGSAGMNLHVHVFSGENRHHIHESIFKALGIALHRATTIDPLLDGQTPSTKGVLE